MDRGIPPELICQLITLGMCLESPRRLATLKPADFLDGEIGAVVHELQQMVASPPAEPIRLDGFLAKCGVRRNGKISDAIAAQVPLDSQARRMLDQLRRFAAGCLGGDKRGWISEAKKAIGDV